MSCLQVCNFNKRIKTICQGIYVLSRATYIAKCCWSRNIIKFILNFFPCLPKEYMERKLGEWARDTSLDLLSMRLSRSFVLMRFEFYHGWQKFWYTGRVYAVCICSRPAGFPPLPCGDQSLLLGTSLGEEKDAVLPLKCDWKYWVQWAEIVMTA